MQPTATAGGGVMYSRVIRKEDPALKRMTSRSYNRAARPFSYARPPVIIKTPPFSGQ